jgi:hypothetical protein
MTELLFDSEIASSLQQELSTTMPYVEFCPEGIKRLSMTTPYPEFCPEGAAAYSRGMSEAIPRSTPLNTNFSEEDAAISVDPELRAAKYS